MTADDAAPTLADPGDQSDAEGQAVSLPPATTDPDGQALTFSAGALPPGLTIDPDSGLISGDVSSAAASAAAVYTTTVALHDAAGQTVTQTFQWSVSVTDPPPWLADPLTQTNAVNDAVHLQLEAGDPDGDALSYTAGGLPPGLGVDPHTGLISGAPQQVGSYNASVSVTDGVTTVTRPFVWTVTPAPVPAVTLDVNGTPTHTDDVALVGAAPIPVVVTLSHASAGQHKVEVELPASDEGRASLGLQPDASGADQVFLEMSDGGSATLWLTALAPSAAEDDVQILAYVDPAPAGAQPAGNPAPPAANGLAKVTNELISFDKHIRAADTPEGMADRIPPRVTTGVAFQLSAPLTEGQKVWFNVSNQGDKAAGAVEKLKSDGTYGTASLTIPTGGTGKGFFNLRGVAGLQTQPGHAGKLKLIVWVGDNTNSKLSSDGFSVAAIPIAVTASNKVKVEGEETDDVQNGKLVGYLFRYGADYTLTYKSDSNDPHDLDQVQVKEKIETHGDDTNVAIPYFKNLQVGTWTAADTPDLDKISPQQGVNASKATRAQAAALAGPLMAAAIRNDGDGVAMRDQYFIFTDARTDPAQGHPFDPNQGHSFLVGASGFLLKYGMQESSPGVYVVRVLRTAAANHDVDPGVVDPTAAGFIDATL